MKYTANSILILLVAISTCFSARSYGKEKHEWKERSAGGYSYKYVSGDSMQARFYKLKNGLTVILSPSHKEPRMQFYIAVKAGSKTDPPDHTGLAHYLEHMMFKGTQNYGTVNWTEEKPWLDKIDNLYEEYNHTTDATKRKDIYRRIDSVSGIASTFAIANEYRKMVTSMGSKQSNASTSLEKTVYEEDIPANAVDKFLKVQAERFRDPVIRLFHTELEAVYEEKNRGIDNDDQKASETMLSALFLNHNYGKQTTIGTIEHLKNPSLLEIRKYYNTYYVPNNMGIIVAGDFDPDVMIKKIDQYFSAMEEKPVPAYTFKPEQPIKSPVVKEVYGPAAEYAVVAYRLPGIHSKDLLLASLASTVLSNGSTGLIDLDLVKKQKLLVADASVETMIDYGFMELYGKATSGQSLEEVKAMLLGEIEDLKKGKFDDDLLPAIMSNAKKAEMQKGEKYNSRAKALLEAFTNEEDWLDDVAAIESASRYTKKDIMAFAKKYLDDNYVVIYKRRGEDKNKVKVEKPHITPITTNLDSESLFVKNIMDMPVGSITPVWLDYDRDIQKGAVGPAEILYVANKENGLFNLAYRYHYGTWNDKKLAIAAEYLNYLGTDTKSSATLSKEFFKIACSFSIEAGREYTTVNIEGLQENFGKAVSMFEDLLAHCTADEQALTALKASMNKTRADNKDNKDNIMRGLLNYAMYGPDNPFNNVLSADSLQSITGIELTSILHDLGNYSHTIIYYGPATMAALTASLKSVHKMPEAFKQAPASKVFTFAIQKRNEVLFADYDMVQSEITWVRNICTYDPAKQSVISVFNNYFGRGSGSLVYQSIRASKGLAYSTSASVNTPEKKGDPYYMRAYVGCQADKFKETMRSMNDLLINRLPSVENNMQPAMSAVKKDIESERITGKDIIDNYLAAQRKGLNEDIRRDIYEQSGKITLADLEKFHAENLAGKPYTYCIVASEKRLNMADVMEVGETHKLTLKDIFGY